MGKSYSYVKDTEETFVLYPDGIRNIYERKKDREIKKPEDDLIEFFLGKGLAQREALREALNAAEGPKSKQP